MSEKTYTGVVLGCNGGLYGVYSGGVRYECYAKGAFRHEKLTPLAGDNVEFTIDGEYGYINAVFPRKNEFIRPPAANLARLFAVCAAKKPLPSTLALDKMCCIAANRGVQVIIVINKCELDPAKADELYGVYSKCGYKTLRLYDSPRDPRSVREALLPLAQGGISAFSGASGVGKTTILNALYPELVLTTGSVSRKTGRGVNTTRLTMLYPTGPDSFAADTPGFTLLDFDRFFFFKKEELPGSFPEFAPYLGKCRYVKCTHTKEEGCAVLEAVRRGEIPTSRHESYLDIFESLKKQKEWELKT